MVVPASPLHQKPTLGLDLQGGLEITKQAVPPKGRKLTKEDLEPLGHDHARPRRPPRRLRAGDPHAGQRPDHDPAAGRQGSRGGREDHRQDGAARALRPRDEPRAAVDRHQRQPDRRARASTTCSPASRRSSRASPTSAGSSTRRRSSSSARSRRRRRRSPSTTASCRTGYKLFGTPNGTVVDLVRRAGAVVCPGVEHARPRTRTTSSSTTRRPCRR